MPAKMDITTKIEINTNLIRCSECFHPIATYPGGKKYYFCPKNKGTFPSGAKFEECRHYVNRVQKEKEDKNKKV